MCKTNEELEAELRTYEKEIAESKEALKKMRLELAHTQKVFQKKMLALENIKQELQKEKSQQETLRLDKRLPLENKDIKEIVLPCVLEEVEVYDKDNTIMVAKPLKRLFSEELYLQYRSLLRENKILKNQLSKKDFEISVLKIELRDMHKEIQLYQNQNLLKDE
ncbi:nickel-binding protein Mua [Helicobacter cetorum]|uniref:nickel-binding protein Mua n=1 Tax=Helicobacter cetorum TaxID=138563 RepID=UPI000CF08EA8|nr:nickel-binding protein Mua [Helicobacter cetorum]